MNSYAVNIHFYTKLSLFRNTYGMMIVHVGKSHCTKLMYVKEHS